MDSSISRVMHQEALQPIQQQLNHEIYNLSWVNNQILANGLPINQQFNYLNSNSHPVAIPETLPVYKVEDDILPESGVIEFEDAQESDEFDCDISSIIQWLGNNINQFPDDTSSKANFGTLHAELPQNNGYPEPAMGDYGQQINQNIITFNIQENFTADQLQQVFYHATAAPVAQREQYAIDTNIFNDLSFGLPFINSSTFAQALVRPDEIASALPVGNEIFSPETQPRPKPEAAPASQTGATGSILKNISVDRNNPHENIHLKNYFAYDEPDIKNVVFPGPFSPLNKYITNCNPVERKASIEHEDKTQTTDETDPPTYSFWKVKSSVRVPWEENLSSCDLVEFFEQAKRVSVAKARSTIEQRYRGRPVTRRSANRTKSPPENAQSRKKSRNSGGRKKVTVTTPGPVTRSQTRRLRTD